MAHTPILLELFPLPYTSDLPPKELYHPVQTVAECSDTVAFHTHQQNVKPFDIA